MAITDGTKNVILGTHQGQAICFKETDVRPMGRDAAGVRGIRLSAEDYVVGAEIADESACLLTVTENGYGKRTEISEYTRGDGGEPQHRGGKGMKNYNITPKTGLIAGIRMVTDEEDVMIISDDGTIIRMPAKDINIYGRSTQGVILMRVEEGSRVISIEKVASEPEAEEEASADTAAEE